MNIKTVALFGISDFGMGFLKNLIKSKYEIVFVTAKSKPVLHVVGLENKLEKLCKKNRIEYLGNADANSPAIIKKCQKVDLCILGGYDKILKKEVLSAPKIGFINTHLGIIPENRGCNPSMWAILNNIQQGATTYFVNEKIDKGAIIDIKRLEIDGLNSHEAYQALSNIVSDNIIKCIEKIEREEAFLEMSGKERYHRAGMPNDGYTSWSWNLEFIKKFSDAMIFPPYRPMATIHNNTTVYLTCEKIEKIHLPGLIDGTVVGINGRDIKIKASDGIAHCVLFKDYEIRIADSLVYRLGKNHTIEEGFREDFIK